MELILRYAWGASDTLSIPYCYTNYLNKAVNSTREPLSRAVGQGQGRGSNELGRGSKGRLYTKSKKVRPTDRPTDTVTYSL